MQTIYLGNNLISKNITKVSQLENDANYIQDDVVSDGVYAVDANGKLIDYNTADTTATGVVLVAGEHKFMIAKADATDGTNSTLYWGKNLSGKDVAGVVTNGKVDGTNSSGYLAGTSTPQLNKDFTTWTAGALSEFNGKANTAAIINGYTEHGISMDARDMCTVLNTFNAADSYSDWYVPACGQLALMYLNMTEINAALTKIGGTALDDGNYWSSSECAFLYAWNVRFSTGLVEYKYKDNSGRVRFVRDISTTLKERVSDLESQLGDINAALDYIINGPKLITFTLTQTTYDTVYTATAEEGMTWEEWFNSDYDNPCNVKVYGQSVICEDWGVQLNGIAQYSYDVLQNGANYTFKGNK